MASAEKPMTNSKVQTPKLTNVTVRSTQTPKTRVCIFILLFWSFLLSFLFPMQMWEAGKLFKEKMGSFCLFSQCQSLQKIYTYILKVCQHLGWCEEEPQPALSSFIGNRADLVSGLFCFDQLKNCYQSLQMDIFL